jgi:hypothetical protein
MTAQGTRPRARLLVTSFGFAWFWVFPPTPTAGAPPASLTRSAQLSVVSCRSFSRLLTGLSASFKWHMYSFLQETGPPAVGFHHMNVQKLLHCIAFSLVEHSGNSTLTQALPPSLLELVE